MPIIINIEYKTIRYSKLASYQLNSWNSGHELLPFCMNITRVSNYIHVCKTTTPCHGCLHLQQSNRECSHTQQTTLLDHTPLKTAYQLMLQSDKKKIITNCQANQPTQPEKAYSVHFHRNREMQEQGTDRSRERLHICDWAHCSNEATNQTENQPA